MPETFGQRCQRWRLDELLAKYPGLRLQPTVGPEVVLSGDLAFCADTGHDRIEDTYDVRICIPVAYPRLLPHVWETKNRIQPSFHKLQNGSLCLGSETRLRLIVSRSPSILFFVERCVVPYLYGHSYYEKHGQMPFGELSHGAQGIIEDLAELFGVQAPLVAGFIRAAAMKKGIANKLPCPCGRERRLGSCHRKRVNALRKQLGRSWFRFLKIQLGG